LEDYKSSKYSQIEAVLKQHPGVRETAVVGWESTVAGEHIVGYVVPNDDYVALVPANAGGEGSLVRKWRTVFDIMQKGKEAAAAEPGFNIVSWNSSYTRQPIPFEQMRDWVESTVTAISSLEPKEVLEIGCGTGLLLLRLASKCRRYVASDFSSASLKQLAAQMEKLPGKWDAVTLSERLADNFDGFPDDSFDTVIINSVAQYFPNVSYLTRVLEGAVNVTRPGGSIFIGDVRSLPLLEAFALSVELFQAPPVLSAANLRERVRRRVRQQEELLLSPALFLALQRRFPKVSGVKIAAKLGKFDNEMTCFRYDVTLQLGPDHNKSFELPWLNWAEQKLSLDAIRALLTTEKPDTLGIKAVPNSRIEKDVEALAMLPTLGPSVTVGELRETLLSSPIRGLSPQSLLALGEELGYEVELSWANSKTDGSYDSLFERLRQGEQSPRRSIGWPQPETLSEDLSEYANNPARSALRRKLIPQLLEHAQEKLPPEMVPASIVILDSLPLSATGQLDPQALPRPDLA